MTTLGASNAVSLWIESHVELRDHPKTDRLMDALGVTRREAVGLLHMLWWRAVTYAPSGDLSSFTDGQIARWTDWDPDPALLVSGLTASGFLDDDRQLHDWGDYAGRLIYRRQQDAQNKARQRALYNSPTLVAAVRARDHDCCRYCARGVNWKDRRGPSGGTYDHVDPDGENDLSNLVVACRSCNAGKGHRTPTESGYVLLPVPADLSAGPTGSGRNVLATGPNRTGPNRTGPDRTVPPPQTPPVHGRGRAAHAADKTANGTEGTSTEPVPDLMPLSCDDLAVLDRARSKLRDLMSAANYERLVERLEPLGRSAEGAWYLRAPPGEMIAARVRPPLIRALFDEDEQAGRMVTIVES
jgi:hypothetical protein